MILGHSWMVRLLLIRLLCLFTLIVCRDVSFIIISKMFAPIKLSCLEQKLQKCDGWWAIWWKEPSCLTCGPFTLLVCHLFNSADPVTPLTCPSTHNAHWLPFLENRIWHLLINDSRRAASRQIQKVNKTCLIWVALGFLHLSQVFTVSTDWQSDTKGNRYSRESRRQLIAMKEPDAVIFGIV